MQDATDCEQNEARPPLDVTIKNETLNSPVKGVTNQGDNAGNDDASKLTLDEKHVLEESKNMDFERRDLTGFLLSLGNADLATIIADIKEQATYTGYLEFVRSEADDPEYDIGLPECDEILEIENYQKWVRTNHNVAWSPAEALSRAKLKSRAEDRLSAHAQFKFFHQMQAYGMLLVAANVSVVDDPRRAAGWL